MQRVGSRFFPPIKQGSGLPLETPVTFRPLIFLAFLYLSFAVNYPGHLNPDSLEQLVWAAHPSRMTDWHSPVVTWLWSISGPLLGQPAGALIIQCLCFSLFVAVLPVFPEYNVRAAALLLAEGFFRLSLVAIAGIVVKDVLLLALILSIIAALQLARSSEDPTRWLSISAALTIPALLVRPTNFLMLLITWALISPMVFRTVRSYFLALLAAGALLVGVVPATNYVNRTILGARNARAEKQLIIFDLAGMSKHSNRNLFATLPEWPVNKVPPPIPCYTPKRWDPYFFIGQCHQYAAAFDETSRRTGSNLTGWWIGQVIRHPLAYLLHRADYSHKLLRTDRHIIYAQPPYSDTLNSTLDPRYLLPEFNAEIREEGRIGVAHIDKWQNTLVEEPFAKLSTLIFSQRNAYLLSLIVCAALWAWNLRQHFRGREGDPIVTIVAAAGIGNAGMLVFFGVASEGRYLLPTVCCACIAALIALRPLARRKSPAPT